MAALVVGGQSLPQGHCYCLHCCTLHGGTTLLGLCDANPTYNSPAHGLSGREITQSFGWVSTSYTF